MNTINKQTKKAFNLSECTNLDYELYNYIDSNLFADNITIQNNNKIIVYQWKFSPQRSGTNYQNNSYKVITIRKKVQTIKETIFNLTK
tara:strand:+ start:3056 stop:3319 length:264 start_codon:yes stop_codon:yes gene_type:complete